MWFELSSDLKTALRSFTRAPGTTGLIVMTLACAIAASTIGFAFADLAILRGLPVDDTSYMLYAAIRKKPGWERAKTRPGGKLWSEMTEAEHQRYPDDYEAQVGQGPLTLHSEEHLGHTDKGVIMLRKLLLRQADLVAKGKDPLGVRFDARKALVRTCAGNFLDG